MKKANLKNLISNIVIILLIICIIYSSFNILIWFKENKKTKDLQNKITENVQIKETEDNENTEIIEPNNDIQDDDPYWSYIKQNLINVDFNELKNINNDVEGWIQVNGTNVNYPFVQTTNNDFYLDHSIDKEKNSAGWLFLDYRNNMENLDKNTIIYAHNRKDKSMFGSLKNTLTKNWLNNTDNFIIKLSTPYENTLWQIFSIYHIPTTNDYIRTNFSSNTDFLEFANMLIGRSVHNFNTSVSENDYILTLSTCHGKTEKLVIHAKLIKKETR